MLLFLIYSITHVMIQGANNPTTSQEMYRTRRFNARLEENRDRVQLWTSMIARYCYVVHRCVTT
jgi:hypothetical protein